MKKRLFKFFLSNVIALSAVNLSYAAEVSDTEISDTIEYDDFDSDISSDDETDINNNCGFPDLNNISDSDEPLIIIDSSASDNLSDSDESIDSDLPIQDPIETSEIETLYIENTSTIIDTDIYYTTEDDGNIDDTTDYTDNNGTEEDFSDIDDTVITGWTYYNNYWHYLDSQGQVIIGWQLINDQWYYFDNSGKMLTGWQYINDSWYYMSGSGRMLTGWQYINDKWYYFCDWGGMLTGWQCINDKWYYFCDWGNMLTGWQCINDSWYYMSGSGRMLTGWQYINDSWYYMSGSGKMLTGWQYINDKWYYFSDWGGMLTGWQYINDKWYYLCDWGNMLTGWQYINDKWYYFCDWGNMLTGWLFINDKWYYCMPSSGYMITGRYVINDSIYLFKKSGAWVDLNNINNTDYTGFINIDDDWYYIENNSFKNVTNVIKGTVNGQTDWWYIENDKVDFAKNDTFTNGIRTYTIENGKATECNYYFIDNEITLPSGGYNLTTDNIGLKVVKVNQAVLDSSSEYYTDSTKTAVYDFQVSHNINATGEVDLETWKALGYSEYDWYNLGTYVTSIKTSGSSSASDCTNAMVQTAKEYADANTGYRSGASGSPGTYVDCSGLIYQCLYSVGINPVSNIVTHSELENEYGSTILADDDKLGQSVSFDDMQAGDLVFYAHNGSNTVCHVAICAGNYQIYDSYPNLGVTLDTWYINTYYIKKIIRVF